MDLTSALARAREKVNAAAHRAGRAAGDVRIIAVTKGFGPDRAQAVLAAGVVQLGESRVQEARAKIPEVLAAMPAAQPTWHLIGHLQTNKAGVAAQLFDWVHSVDSIRVAEALDRHRRGSPLPILVQIKTSAEATKSGMDAAAALDEVPRIAALSNLEVRGLMTIPAFAADPAATRRAFRSLRELAGRLAALRVPGVRMEQLSMGMSRDYEIAIEEGATMVRLGTALFGPRPPRR